MGQTGPQPTETTAVIITHTGGLKYHPYAHTHTSTDQKHIYNILPGYGYPIHDDHNAPGSSSE